jgi:hypothetical protein
MKFGIQKRQWVLLLPALSAPLLLNAVAIWQDVGTASILKMWTGSYPNPYVGFLGGSYNPLPEIAWDLFLHTAALGVTAWLIILLSNQAFFRRQPRIIQRIELGLLSLLSAVVFAIVAGILMPFVWLPIFHSFQLGLPASHFAASWSLWMILPITLTLFIAIFASKD